MREGRQEVGDEPIRAILSTGTLRSRRRGHLKGWLKRRPIAGFALLAFGISYLIGGPVLLAGMWAIPANAVLARTYVPRVLVVFGPGLAALVLAHLSQKDGGATALLRRLVPSWADVPWAAAVVAAGAVVATGALAMAGVGAKAVGLVVAAHPALLAINGFLQTVVVACGEELGWRGWLLPRLLERTDRLRGTSITALVWGIWHGPLLLAGVGSAALFLFMVFGVSALLTWIWQQRRGGLFAVVVAHASVNTPLYFWEQVATANPHKGAELSVAWYALQAIYAVAGTMFVVANWRRWSRPSDMPAPPVGSSAAA
jgi:uncharacterized protein